MAYGISNKCAKNFCKRTVLVHVIVEDVVTRFYWDTVYHKTWVQSWHCPEDRISCHTLGPRVFLQKKIIKHCARGHGIFLTANKSYG